jgi:hypothetical protein
MTEDEFDRMRYEALPLIQFVGGPLDGQRPVPPESNSVLRLQGYSEGRYEYFAGRYFWITQ